MKKLFVLGLKLSLLLFSFPSIPEELGTSDFPHFGTDLASSEGILPLFPWKPVLMDYHLHLEKMP